MALTMTKIANTKNQLTNTMAIVIGAGVGPGRLFLFIANESGTTGTVRTVSSISLGTWTKRASANVNAGGGPRGAAAEVWYQDVPASTTGTVTITFNANFDSASSHLFIVTPDAGSIIGFDANAVWPVSLNGAASGESVVSTTSTAPLLMFFSANASAVASSSPVPAAVTVLDSLTSNGGTFACTSAVAGGDATQQSSASVGFSSIPSGNVCAIVLDAVIETGGAAPQGNMLAVMGL